MHEIGVVHGRFQLFHNDHLRYVAAAQARCRHLVVGITNPDPTLTKFDPADPGRSAPERNPLTYYERYRVVKKTLETAGWDPTAYSLVPLPINFPELYRYYVPLTATFFLTIYDAWGERKLHMFQALGLRIEVLWRRPLAAKGLTSTQVRQVMAAGGDWQTLVPAGAAAMLTQLGIPARLQAIKQSGEQ